MDEQTNAYYGCPAGCYDPANHAWGQWNNNCTASVYGAQCVPLTADGMHYAVTGPPPTVANTSMWSKRAFPPLSLSLPGTTGTTMNGTAPGA